MSTQTDGPSCHKPLKKAPPPPPPRRGVSCSPTSPRAVPSFSSIVASTPVAVHSEYLMNDIPRGTSKIKLINSLLAPELVLGIPAVTHAHVQFGINLVDSRLDDELSVASIQFSDTPKWLQLLNQDTYGFPKITALGTLWRGVDRTATDAQGRTEFIRGVRPGKKGMNFLYTEMLAEFPDTDVNIQDAAGRTALHWACAGSPAELDMVTLCLQVPNCDIGLKDGDGLTAFDLAIRSGDERIQALFYNSMLELDESDPQAALLRILTVTSVKTENPVFPGEALFDPVTDSNTRLVRALLARGVELSTWDENGDTALHLAAAKPDNVEITSLLLDAGCDVDAVGHGGATPLHYAVHLAGDLQVVQVLLDHKANVGAKDDGGRTALQLAEESPNEALVLLFEGLKQVYHEPEALPAHHEVTETFTEYTAGRDVEQHPAPQRSTVDIGREPDIAQEAVAPVPEMQADDVKESQEHFLEDIDAKDPSGVTALHRAAGSNDLEAVRLLLIQGANMEARDSDFRTALHLAACHGHKEMVNALLAAGAKVEAASSLKRTALHLAAQYGHAKVVNALVNALVAAGAKVEAFSRSQKTALHFAAENGRSEVVNALLAAGAKVEAMNDSRETALHIAARNGHAEVINALLAAGAKVEAMNNSRETALHLAVSGGCKELVKALLEAGASIKATDSANETVLHVAARQGDITTVMALLAAGARLETRGDNGTPYQVALRAGHRTLCGELQGRGARTTSVARFRHAIADRLERKGPEK